MEDIHNLYIVTFNFRQWLLFSKLLWRNLLPVKKCMYVCMYLHMHVIYDFNYSFHNIFYLHIYFYVYIFMCLILSNKMPVQTQSTWVKAPVTSNPDNIFVEALSTNEKATLSLWGRVGFDRPLQMSITKAIRD